MVVGLDVFREHFKDFQGSYVLLGGVACFLTMDKAGVDDALESRIEIIAADEQQLVAFEHLLAKKNISA